MSEYLGWGVGVVGCLILMFICWGKGYDEGLRESCEVRYAHAATASDSLEIAREHRLCADLLIKRET